MRWKAKGSLTVEASLVVPIVLFVIFLLLSQGLELYAQVAETVKKQEMWEEFKPSETFQRLELLGSFISG